MTEPTLTCPNGHENPPGGRFCETCGAALAVTAAQPPAATPPPPAPPQAAATGSGVSSRFVFMVAAFVAIAAAIATAGAFVLFTGGDDDPAAADETTPTADGASATDTAEPAATDTPDATATPTALPGATRDNPLALGVPKRGFDGWEVFVVRSDFDVVQDVMAENSNNEPPTDGYTFVLVRLNATNREAEPDEGETTTEYRARQLILVDADGIEHHTFDNDGCGVIPDGFAFLDNPQSRGGTVEGNICFHIPQEITDDLVLFDDGSNTWFALR